MMIIKAVLMMLGALLALAALCWACMWMERKAPIDDYDERQKIEHGKASQISLMTGFVYFLVVICWMYMDTMPADGFFLIFAGLVLQMMVYHIYCLMTHSALPLSRKPWMTIGTYALLGVVWALRASMYDPAWGMSLHGSGSGFWTFVLTSFCCFALMVMHLVSLFWKEKE